MWDNSCSQTVLLQMTTVLDENIHNFGVDGSSDDLDVPIKAVFADLEYTAKHALCSINSINWARYEIRSRGRITRSLRQNQKQVPLSPESWSRSVTTSTVTSNWLRK